MIDVTLFAEDVGHEVVVSSLIKRIAKKCDKEVRVHVRSATGGRGQLKARLDYYVKDIIAEKETLHDVLVVAIDANCQGRSHWQNELNAICEPINERDPQLVVLVIPDPHVERWLLLDSQAFRRVFGQGCDAPDLKCEKERYKRVLQEEVHRTGVRPLVGGLEFAEKLVGHMDIDRMTTADASLGQAIQDIQSRLQNV